MTDRLPFLADTAAPGPDFMSNIGWFMIMGAALIAAIYHLRRKPPIAEELYRDFASRSDLQAMAKKIETDLSSLSENTEEKVVKLHARIEIQQRHIEEQFQSIERSLGRIEGKLERRH